MKMMTDLYNLMNEVNNMFYKEALKKFDIDLLEIENGYKVIAEIPGFKKENINITFEEGSLTIEAKREKEDGKYLIKERSDLDVKRVINLGDIEEESLTAKYENGLLTVTIITKEPDVKKPISINIE